MLEGLSDSDSFNCTGPFGLRAAQRDRGRRLFPRSPEGLWEVWQLRHLIFSMVGLTYLLTDDKHRQSALFCVGCVLEEEGTDPFCQTLPRPT